MWDIIEAPSTINKCTLAMICTYISTKYDVTVDSLSWGDFPLYAEYMVDSDDRYRFTVAEAIEAVMDDYDDEMDGIEEDEDGFVDHRAGGDSTDINRRIQAEIKWKMAKHRGYVDLDATTNDDDSLQIPPIRIYFHANKNINQSLKEKKKRNAAQGRDAMADEGGKIRKMGYRFAARLRKLKHDVREKCSSLSSFGLAVSSR